MDDRRDVGRHDQAAVRRAGEGLDGALNVGGVVLDRTEHNVDPERRAQGLALAQVVIIKGGRLGVGHEGGAHKAGRDLLEHREPLAGDAGFVLHHASDIAARPRQAGDEARADRVGDAGEHDRDRAAFPLQRGDDGRPVCEDRVWLQGDQLFREHLRLSAGRCKAVVDADIVAFRPSTLFKPLPEAREAGLCFGIVLGEAHQRADPPHPLGLLRANRERPRCRRAAEQAR